MRYYITAVDIAGLESNPSKVVYSNRPFTLPDKPGPRSTAKKVAVMAQVVTKLHPPPPAPTGLVAQERPLGLKLEWNPFPMEDELQYRIYRSINQTAYYEHMDSVSNPCTNLSTSMPDGWYYITAENHNWRIRTIKYCPLWTATVGITIIYKAHNKPRWKPYYTRLVFYCHPSPQLSINRLSANSIPMPSARGALSCHFASSVAYL